MLRVASATAWNLRLENNVRGVDSPLGLVERKDACA
jgi:hypothetical protein